MKWKNYACFIWICKQLETENFWVHKCEILPSCWVVYRRSGKEILVEMAHGKIIYMQEKLLPDELTWFEENINLKF